MAADNFWSAVYTYANLEQRASENLRRQDFETVLPMVSQPRPGLSSPPPRPLFPCYLFVRLTNDTPWGSINSTHGVIRLLTSASTSRPSRVPDTFIASLQQQLTTTWRSGVVVLEPGTMVRITRGRLVDKVAVVKWSLDDRLGLLFRMLGREVEIEFSLDDVRLEEELSPARI